MFRYIPGPRLLLPNLGHNSQGLDKQLYREAGSLFLSFFRKSRVRHFWRKLLRQNGTLLDLSAVRENCRVTSQYDLGSESIPLDKIVGSASRSQDFDPEFRPLLPHLRQRWVNIAALRLLNVSLPAVELVQIAEVFYVVDGHHRVSVARALGQSYIDARVVVWHLELKPSPGMVDANFAEQNVALPALSWLRADS